MKKNGFTLAEVLITLGIIGVVAAMTLPTLIKNYQKQVWAISAKKSYAVVSNMFQKMMADEGVSSITDTTLFTKGICVFTNNNSNSCEDAYGNPSILLNIIPKYLKIIKVCEGNECNLKYKDIVLDNTGKLSYEIFGGELVEADTLTYARGKVYGFYANDGAIYYISFGGWGDEENASSNASIKICFDTNGEKGPNIRGRDTFCMEYCRNKNGKITSFLNGSSCWADYSEADLENYQAQYPIIHLIKNGWKMDY